MKSMGQQEKRGSTVNVEGLDIIQQSPALCWILNCLNELEFFIIISSTVTQ